MRSLRAAPADRKLEKTESSCSIEQKTVVAIVMEMVVVEEPPPWLTGRPSPSQSDHGDSIVIFHSKLVIFHISIGIFYVSGGVGWGRVE